MRVALHLADRDLGWSSLASHSSAHQFALSLSVFGLFRAVQVFFSLLVRVILEVELES